MKFIIDADRGDLISGWLILDNPSATPSFIARAPGHADVKFEANVRRPDLRDIGVSTIEQVGFELNAQLMPDLPLLSDLTISEAESGLPLYRRFPSGDKIEKRLYLFDAAFIPQQHIYEALESRFALTYRGCERHGLETIISLLTNPTSGSMFAAGRLGFRYDYFLKERDFIRAALLREPYEDLAERLLLLSLAAKNGKEAVVMQYFAKAEPLLELVRNLALDDPKEVRAAFRELTDRQRDALVSPVTRILACDFGEPPRDLHISIALDNLAALDLVGTREHFPIFKALLSEITGVDLLGDAEITSFGQVGDLAETLRKINVIGDLIHEDLALYALVSSAIEEGQENLEQNK